MLRQILGYRRRPNETFERFLPMTTNLAKCIFHGMGQLSLCTLALYRIHQLAGRAFAVVSRELGDLAADDPVAVLRRSAERATKQSSICTLAACMLWHDGELWALQQAIGETLDHRNSTQWRHDKPGRHAQWEDALVHVFGQCWKERATEPTWAVSLSIFVQKVWLRIRNT